MSHQTDKLKEIDFYVYSLKSCGWVKRRNTRKKLINKHNSEVIEEMLIIKGKIRDLRAMGTTEQNLRFWYAELSKKEGEII